jgi:hypothetical protein
VGRLDGVTVLGVEVDVSPLLTGMISGGGGGIGGVICSWLGGFGSVLGSVGKDVWEGIGDVE